MNKNIIVINDTRRASNHVGCELVMNAIIEACRQRNYSIELLVKHPEKEKERFYQALDRCSTVIVNGEGSIHHDQPVAIEIFRLCLRAKMMGKHIHLINSVWQNNLILNAHAGVFSSIYVRESESMAELEKAGIKSQVVGDLTLATPINTKRIESEQNVKTIYIDSWHDHISYALKSLAKRDHKPFYIMSRHKRQNLKNVLINITQKNNYLTLNTLKQMDKRGICITGRFHGATISALNSVPFVLISSNSHKTLGLVKDMFPNHWKNIYIDHQKYSHEAVNTAASYVKSHYTSLKRDTEFYVDHQKRKIDQMFNQILPN